MKNIEKIVPDTSVIIEGVLSSKIKKKELFAKEVIISEAVLSELEHQANLGKSVGFLGIDEIKALNELSKKKNFVLSFKGNKPRPQDIKNAYFGEIDSMIRTLAWDEGATIITSDKVQSEVALSKGMDVIYVEQESYVKKIKLEKFFDDSTMSVHLRENVMPYAKKGAPGNWKFLSLRKTVLKQEEIQEISREIIEEAKLRKDGFIEIERQGSTIIQLGLFRIVITRPPFSDGWEITAVRPVKRLSLDDYNLSEKLMKRISEQADGILVAGSPGMGKTTFAQALSEFYASKEKVVKTVEAPRDLVLSDNITQYAISHGDSQEIHDILLLSRPDYTIFDEMRNTEDFKLFSDMRLAGVGMVGVVHGTNPIDAIQRFIGRVEMGVIPQIVDTVIFIKDGTVNKVLSLSMTVKVPSGMMEADLARPVVTVFDFENDELEYEIYSYGEQTVVIPVSNTVGLSKKKSGTQKIAAGVIENYFKKYSKDVIVDVVSENKCRVYVPENCIAKIIGKGGKRIGEIENELGMKIDVLELNGVPEGLEEKREEIRYNLGINKKQIVIELGSEMKNRDCDIYVDSDFLMAAKSSKTGVIKIKKDNPLGREILKGIKKGKSVFIY